MSNINQTSVYDRRSLFVWTLFCILAGIIFLTYALTSLTLGRGVFVMPLDDVYIHFQYAKQMGLGQPYVYNPGLPPTSGATSFLYPYMLAIGYLLGFQGLNLGLWAMLLGMVALACSTWLVYRLLKAFDAPRWLAILAGVIFALSGPVSWHFVSGMETGWVVLFTLGTLYAFTPRLRQPSPSGRGEQMRVRSAVIFATLLALIRPEGGILAGLAMVALFAQVRRQGARHVVPLLIPILAIGVQPLVNLLLTASAVASGNAAKSVFGMIPFYWDAVIGRILSNWAQMWSEFLSGSSPREGLYIAPLMLVLALIGLLILLRDRKGRVIGLMLIGWLAFGTLAISTLDTAFWHFKRYQMPFIALLFPLAGWGISALWGKRKSQTPLDAQAKMPFLLRLFDFLTTLRDPVIELLVPRPRNESSPFPTRTLLHGLIVLIVLSAGVISAITGAQFLRSYGLNVHYVYQQPLQMARWLEANTPPDAVIAVHDVGMMRYMGGRTTLDMVGLTTPGAADYWRNGPGSVAEFLIANRPDYIASYGYGHGFGLGMLADTDLYGQPLASFPVDVDPNFNVALAANFQGIYRPDWENILPKRQVLQESIRQYVNLNAVDGINGIALNVANLDDEARNEYSWKDVALFPGFPTEVHEFDYLNCKGDACHIIDSGRRINGEENFELRLAVPSSNSVSFVLVTRIHPEHKGKLDVYVDDKHVATRWIPEIPGYWLDVPTLISTDFFLNPVRIRIVPDVPGGYYMPFMHEVYSPSSAIGVKPEDFLATFQDGAIVLASAKIDYQMGTKQMPIDIDWYTDGSAQGDYKVFVHILDKSDQIVAQADTYPGNGTLPPGNWLPGVLRDTIVVDLQNTSPGQYRVAIGLYNPYTFERLQPAGGDDQNRFFIGDVEIK